MNGMRSLSRTLYIKLTLNKIQFLKSESKWWYYVSFAGLAIVVLTYRILIAYNPNLELLNGETNNIWNALKVVHGHPIYSNPEDFPFEIFQYTPLSQLPICFFSWIDEHYLHSTDFLFTLTAGRLLSLTYNVLAFILLFNLLSSHLYINRKIAAFGSLLGFCLIPHHFFAIRPDSLALLLIISGIFFFSKSYFKLYKYGFVFSGSMLALSFFAKQDAFIIAGALGLILLLNKNYKNLISFTISFSVTFSILLFLANLFFGQYFFKSIFGGVALTLDYDQFSYVLLRFFTFYYLLIICLIGSLFYLFFSKRHSNEVRLFLSVSLVVSFIFAAFTSFKLGSHFNYYFLLVVWAVITITYAANHFVSNRPTKREFLFIWPLIIGTISLHFLFFQFFHYTSPFTQYANSRKTRSLYLTHNSIILNVIKKSGKKVCAYDYKARLMLQPQVIFPNNEFYGISKFSYKAFDNSVPDKRVEYIVLMAGTKINDTDLNRFNITDNEYFLYKKTPELNIYKHIEP
jgi:hypothetical protein